jgi:hypothetical protein
MIGSSVRATVSLGTAVGDAGLDLADRLGDTPEGRDTMAALVGVGAFELGSGHAQVLERGHHVRLIGHRPAGEEANHQERAEGQHADGTAGHDTVRRSGQEAPPMLGEACPLRPVSA